MPMAREVLVSRCASFFHANLSLAQETQMSIEMRARSTPPIPSTTKARVSRNSMMAEGNYRHSSMKAEGKYFIENAAGIAGIRRTCCGFLIHKQARKHLVLRDQVVWMLGREKGREEVAIQDLKD